MQNKDDHIASLIPWRLIALGACSLVLTFGGLVIGVWSESLDHRLNDIANSQRRQWEVLNERASLSPRMENAERQSLDQEQRLRALERQAWGGKR